MDVSVHYKVDCKEAVTELLARCGVWAGRGGAPQLLLPHAQPKSIHSSLVGVHGELEGCSRGRGQSRDIVRLRCQSHRRGVGIPRR